MRYLTFRVNSDGETRHYFRRRGTPLFRLYGEPGETEFSAQYEYANSISHGQVQWTPRERMRVQNEIRALRKRTDTEKMRLCASKLARSVNSRARHQYKVESEIDTEWVLRTIKEQDGRCALSGIEFSYERGMATKDGRNPLAPSVDRIDCGEGYTVKNCRLVILAVNVALNLWGDDLFIEICRATVGNVGSAKCNVSEQKSVTACNVKNKVK